MRKAWLIILLLLAPLAFGIEDVQVLLQAPSDIIPGETATLSVQTSIGGVPVLSIPAQIEVMWPDGRVTQQELTDLGKGVYQAELYAPQRGVYEVTATIDIAGQDFTATRFITVGQPPYNGTISVTQTEISVDADRSYPYEVNVIGLQTGQVTEIPTIEACSLECTSCSQTCGIEGNIAIVTVEEPFNYIFLRTANQQPDLVWKTRLLSTQRTCTSSMANPSPH